MRLPVLASLEVFAITVASILGLGILGLPVSLYTTGLRPFFLTITLTLIAQICIVYFVVEVFQHAVHYPVYGLPPPQKPTEHTHVDPALPTSPNSSPRPASPATAPDFVSPSLFALADQFIPHRWLRILYNVFVYFHFILLLVTYSLSAPQAFVALVPPLGTIPFTVLCGGFFFACSVLVYVAATRLLPALSFSTFFKAGLLVFLVGLTLARGLVIHRQPVSRWGLMGIVDPFLVNTFSLGGTVHVMPVSLQLSLNSIARSVGPPRVRFDRPFFASYRLAVNLGLFACYLLNVMWCIAVLFVVPQDTSSAVASNGPADVAIPANLTLAYANENGQISTVPLIENLKATNDPSNHFVAFIVNCFIAVSITISILIGLVATLNFLEGSVLSSFLPAPRRGSGDDDDERDALQRDEEEGDMQRNADTSAGAGDALAAAKSFALMWRYWLSVGLIMTIALLNPKALYRIMEGALTIVNNLEAALVLVYMFLISRRTDRSGRSPPPIPDKLRPGLARVFVTFATTFYVVVIIVDLIFYLPSHLF